VTVTRTRAAQREPGVRRKSWTVLIALALFAALAGLPAILPALHLKITTAPPTTSNGITLLGAPQALPPIPLPPAARPAAPAGPTAAFPQVSESLEAAAVSFEDNRLRAMLHDSFRTFQPKILHYRHALPTLLLTSGTHYSFAGGVRLRVPGKSVYTAADLIGNGAMVRLPDGGALLKDNVFVSSGARLELSSSDVGAIYLDTTPSGSASIVAWGGDLDFHGTHQLPLTLQGWDETTMTPARDSGNGRPYIREVAGTMTFEYARASALGFWSGRTGGVSWTGLSTHPSYGGAILSTFTGNTYGVFVTRGRDIRFSGDLFESNQLDGLHFHRGTVASSAAYSAAVRNGANGFHIDRATSRTVLQHDLSQHNATNGFLVDGRPLVVSASASGNGVTPGQGTRIQNSAALGNGRTGILIEGGNRTVLKADEICAKLTGIALRYGASNAIVDANDVRCGSRTGLRIGPQAPGALVYGNAVSGARIAMLVTAPGGSVEIDRSLITLASVFGISVRGVNSIVFGKDNVISGIGFRAVDSRAEATPPHLSGSNTANWAYARKGTVLTYLEFHPLAVFWLSLAFLVLVGCVWTRRRKAPAHPYPESTRWRGLAAEPEPVPVPLDVFAGAPDRLVPVGAHVETVAGSHIGLTPAGAEAGPTLAGTQAGWAAADERVALAAADERVGLAAADERVGLAAADERVGPRWSPDHDARPGDAPSYRGPLEPNGVSPHRGPFEPTLPDAAHLEALPLDSGPLGGRGPGDARQDLGRLDGGRLDRARRDPLPLEDGATRDRRPEDRGPLDGRRRRDGRLDGGPLDGRRRADGPLDGGALDGRRRADGALDGRRRGDGALDGGPLDGRRRADGPLDGRRRADEPLDGRGRADGPLDGRRRAEAQGNPGPLDDGWLDAAARGSRRRENGRRDPGPLDGGRLDGGARRDRRREDARPDSARSDDRAGREAERQEAERRKAERREAERREAALRDAMRRDAERLLAERRESERQEAARREVLRDAMRRDAERLDDAQSYVGQPDEQQPAKKSPSEPLDSTKPLPQVGDRQ
jgi:hypothetical protein